MVRLVCRLLRKLSYPLITTLDAHKPRFLPLVQTEDPFVVTQLRALPGLTKLRYRGDQGLRLASDIPRLRSYTPGSRGVFRLQLGYQH